MKKHDGSVDSNSILFPEHMEIEAMWDLTRDQIVP